jgi:hypothetical protein
MVVRNLLWNLSFARVILQYYEEAFPLRVRTEDFLMSAITVTRGASCDPFQRKHSIQSVEGILEATWSLLWRNGIWCDDGGRLEGNAELTWTRLKGKTSLSLTHDKRGDRKRHFIYASWIMASVQNESDGHLSRAGTTRQVLIDQRFLVGI